MSLAGVGLSYLVLRELPIRNFYARSVIMAAFAYKLGKTWGYDFKELAIVCKSKIKA